MSRVQEHVRAPGALGPWRRNNSTGDRRGPDVNVRLPLYMRLARLASEPEIDAFEDELADRFGPLPPPAEQILLHARWRAMARAARIARIDAGKAGIALTPRGDFAGDPAAHGLRKRAGRWVLQGNFVADRAARVQALLETLAS